MKTLGFSMELSSGALTRLTGLPAVAACLHDGAVLASDGGGLFRIGGATDDGAPVAARFVLPATDCGDPAPKRLPGVAVEGFVPGRLAVAAASDAGSSLEGVAGPAGGAGLPGRAMARLGRGYGRTWRVAFSADDGQPLDVGAIVLRPLSLDRRPA